MVKQTIGNILREQREKYDISLEEAYHELKIKVKYLRYLEQDRFDKFDSKPMVKGFLKNYSDFLGLNYERILALYRRDIENISMKRNVNVVEEENPKFEFNVSSRLRNIVFFKVTKQKITLVTAFLFLIFVGLFIYRTAQTTFDKPMLNITTPIEVSEGYDGSIELTDSEITIRGATEKNTTVTINTIPIEVNTNFEFESEKIPVTEEQNTIVIEAKSSLGTNSKIVLRIKKPEFRIDSMKIKVLNGNELNQTTIKSDEIIFFEAAIRPNEEIELEAKRFLEITTENPSAIKVFINDTEYSLEQNTTKYENTGTEIIQL